MAAEEKAKEAPVTKRRLNRPINVGLGEGILMNGSTTTNFGKRKAKKPLKHMLKKSKTRIMIHQKKIKARKKYLLQFSPFFWRLGQIDSDPAKQDGQLKPVFVNGNGKESS